MTIRKYLVQAIPGYDGLERLQDPPTGRRLYRAGEIIELDDAISDIPGLRGWGIIADYVEPEIEPAEEEAAPVVEAGTSSENKSQKNKG